MEQYNRESNDEITLYDLWKVIAKRKILIGGLFIVIVASTAIGSFLMPDVYRGEAVLFIIKSDAKSYANSDVITAKEITDLIGKVDREKRLRIVPKTNNSLRGINFKPLRDSSNKLVVTIDAKKIEDIPRILLEIVGYLNDIDMIKSAVSREKAILLRQSAELSDLIKSSPDLLSTYHKLFEAGKLSTMGFNPIDVKKRITEIKIELITIEQQLSRLNNGCIEIAAQPYISNKRVSPKILRNVVIAGMLGFLLGVVSAFLAEYITNVKHTRKSGNAHINYK